jgi:hypothetical protein
MMLEQQILGEEDLEVCFGINIGADFERVDFNKNKFQECTSLANLYQQDFHIHTNGFQLLILLILFGIMEVTQNLFELTLELSESTYLKKKLKN